MRLFWAQGYDSTSVADLTKAMGINAPSLYAAFGDKRRLFAEAVAHYRAGPGGFAITAMVGALTARSAITQLLLDAAKVYSNPTCPRGCMVIHAAQNCTTENADVAADLAAIRAGMEGLIRQRIDEGFQAGELSQGDDPAELANFYATVLQGMSIKARDGATTDALEGIARRALQAWPVSRHD